MAALTFIGLACLGWLIGSLVNYLSDVLPVHRRLVKASCAGCSQVVPWINYLSMKPCPQCSRHVSIRAWVVMVVSSIGAGSLGFFPSTKFPLWVLLVLLLYFGVIVVIDIEHHLILHPVSLIGIGLGIGFGWLRHGWVATLFGGLAGFGIMIGLYFFGIVFIKAINKVMHRQLDEEGLGFGDVMLSTVLGLILGWPGITAGLVLAILFGGVGSLLVIGLMLVNRKYQAFLAIPYGPFLVLAAVVLILV